MIQYHHKTHQQAEYLVAVNLVANKQPVWATCYTTHYVVLKAQYQGGLASTIQKKKGRKEKGESDTNNLEIT